MREEGWHARTTSVRCGGSDRPPNGIGSQAVPTARHRYRARLRPRELRTVSFPLPSRAPGNAGRGKKHAGGIGSLSNRRFDSSRCPRNRFVAAAPGRRSSPTTRWRAAPAPAGAQQCSFQADWAGRIKIERCTARWERIACHNVSGCRSGHAWSPREGCHLGVGATLSEDKGSGCGNLRRCAQSLPTADLGHKAMRFVPVEGGVLVRMHHPPSVVGPPVPKDVHEEMVVHPPEVRDVIPALDVVPAIRYVPHQHVDPERLRLREMDDALQDLPCSELIAPT